MSPSMSQHPQSVRLRVGEPTSNKEKKQLRFAHNRSDRFSDVGSPDLDGSLSENYSAHEDDFEGTAASSGGSGSGSTFGLSSGSMSRFSSRDSFQSTRKKSSRAWLAESNVDDIIEEEIALELEGQDNDVEKVGVVKRLRALGNKTISLKPGKMMMPEDDEDEDDDDEPVPSSDAVQKKIKRAIDSMQDPSHSLTKRSFYMARLREWTIANDGKYRSDVAEAGGIEAITGLMRRHLKQAEADVNPETAEHQSDDSEHDYHMRLQQLGIASLANMARQTSLNERIKTARGFKMIFAAMKKYRENANLQEKGLDAIGTLARIEANRYALVSEYDALKVIMGAMQRIPDDVHVHRRACIALFRLSSEDSASLIGNSGAIDAVLASMRNFPEDSKIQKLGCGVLKALARREDTNKTKIITGGGLSTVLRSMKDHQADSGVQEEACRLFGHLSICHLERKFSIARSGALESILRAMQLHPETPNVQVAGCLALVNLTSKLQIAQMANSHGALKIVKEAKAHSPEHAAKIIQRLRTARYAPIVFLS